MVTNLTFSPYRNTDTLFYVIFTLNLDVYFIGTQWQDEKILPNFCIFPFSYFRIFPWIYEKMEKCENAKIRTNFRIFAFSHFRIFPWKNSKMRKCENAKIGPNFRIFQFSHFSIEKFERLVPDLTLSPYRTTGTFFMCIYSIFRCLLHCKTLKIWQAPEFLIFPISLCLLLKVTISFFLYFYNFIFRLLSYNFIKVFFSR